MSKSEILTKFETLAAIPHCSYDTDKMRDFLADFAKDKGCEVIIDSFGNIHTFKGKPKICLQSHYDMVCMGDAPKIEIVYGDDGYMRAKNSSLGADNGIGVAIMMQMISEFDDIECLFTNNEEVGMIGATGFNGELKADKLLNLDSEEDDRVTIGCAGGVNLFATISLNSKKIKESTLYEVKVSGLPGGHSGNEIHKNIPNAPKLLAKFRAEEDCELISLDFGERSNSIPANAICKALCAHEPKQRGLAWVKSLGEGEADVLVNSGKILALINSFAQGVRSYDTQLGMVNESINLSTVKQKGEVIEFDFFGRAMKREGLENLGFETSTLASALGFDVRVADRSANWAPCISDFAHLVLEELQKQKPQAKFAAVHAGLECGVLVAKQPELQACSIGPNIHSPHSVNEHCEIASVEMIAEVVRNIIARLQ